MCFLRVLAFSFQHRRVLLNRVHGWPYFYSLLLPKQARLHILWQGGGIDPLGCGGWIAALPAPDNVLLGFGTIVGIRDPRGQADGGPGIALGH